MNKNELRREYEDEKRKAKIILGKNNAEIEYDTEQRKKSILITKNRLFYQDNKRVIEAEIDEKELSDIIESIKGVVDCDNSIEVYKIAKDIISIFEIVLLTKAGQRI